MGAQIFSQKIFLRKNFGLRQKFQEKKKKGVFLISPGFFLFYFAKGFGGPF